MMTSRRVVNWPELRPLASVSEFRGGFRRFLGATTRDARALAIVLGLLCLSLQLSVLSAAPAFAAGRREVAARTLDQIAALQEEKASRSQIQRKLDSQLLYALRRRDQGRVAQGLTEFVPAIHYEPDGRLLVDLRVQAIAPVHQLVTTHGGLVLSSHPRYHAMRALIPLELVLPLAALPAVQSLRPADQFVVHTGLVSSEGEIAHRADQARATYLVDGTGVKIGVLSDSVDYLSSAQTNGELSNVTILPGQAGSGTGEGTAMLEILHDLAPGADLYFATASRGVAGFAQNILDLQAAGCRVLVDDVMFFNESPFQDGPIAQAISEVSAAGCLFFSSAGNSGNKNKGTSGTWEGDFDDSGPAALGRGGRLHDFGGSQYNTLLSGSGVQRVDLFWADPLGASTNDYDIYVVNSSGSVVRAATSIQDGDDDPYESIPLLNEGERIVIVKYSGADRYLYLATGRGKLEFATSGSVRGHNAAGSSNAFSVAASRVGVPVVPFTGGSSNPVEFFSSDGPRRMFFNPDGSPITPGNFSASGGMLLQKPDVTAADGVSTSVPGFATFLGTSAAAPHAAAVAALLFSYNQVLSAGEVRSLLSSTALDIEAPGFDRDSGVGIVMAVPAIAAAPIPPPQLLLQSVALFDADTNGTLDASECVELAFTLRNLPGLTRLTATGITATLQCTNPEVFVDPAPRVFPDLPAGGTVASSNLFRISTSRLFDCGKSVNFQLQVATSNGISFVMPFQLNPESTGSGATTNFVSTQVPIPIPDLGLAESGVAVSGINAVAQVRVGVYLTHPYDFDLRLSLLSPDGTEILLSENNGGSGDNYGTGCESMTVFSDDGSNHVGSVSAPFRGVFLPDQPLAAFIGKNGTAANGIWRLRVADEAELDSGVLQCWSLEITALGCVDGGGQCLSPPSIVTYPTNQTCAIGGTAQFSVEAQGTAPLGYQWYYAGTQALAGAVGPLLVLSNTESAQAGSYDVVVSNAYGVVRSTAATISILEPPAIAQPPSDLVVTQGQSALFSVVPGGDPPINYQWLFNHTNLLGGATGPSLLLTNAQPAMAGEYQTVVSNPVGSVTSQVATLTVFVPPGILCPSNRVVELGVGWGFDVPTAVGGEVQVQVLGTITNLGPGGTFTATRSWLVSDSLSNSVTCDQTVAVVDSLPPVIACSPDKTLALGAAMGFDAPTARDQLVSESLVYDNSVHDLLYRFDPGSEEVGDEIILDGPGRYLSRFSFEFWGTSASAGSFAGEVQVRLRFYRNDGPPSGSGYAAPGTLLFDSGPYGIPALERATLVFEEFQAEAVVPLTNALPGAFTWTVEFSGLGAGDAAGVDVFSPPVVGNNYADYWVRELGGWSLRTNPLTPINLAARAEAVERGVVVTTVGTVTNALCGGTYRATRTWQARDGVGNEAQCDQTLTVLAAGPPCLVGQPVNQAAALGGTGTFQVEAVGLPALGYQWVFNQTNLVAGGTGATLVLSNAQPGMAGEYQAVVSNPYGAVTSQVATLIVGEPPVIMSQPQGLTRVRGQNAQFEASAEGALPLTYHWNFNCTKTITWANQPTLVLTNVDLADSSTYCVTISNAFGTIISQPATLRVLVRPEILFFRLDGIEGNEVTLTFSTVEGLFYSVEYSTNGLGLVGWFQLPTFSKQMGTGNPTTTQDLNATSQRRFYRIRVE